MSKQNKFIVTPNARFVILKTFINPNEFFIVKSYTSIHTLLWLFFIDFIIGTHYQPLKKRKEIQNYSEQHKM